MLKKTLLAGIILAVPALALVPHGVSPVYVPVAHAADADPKPEDLAKNAWAVFEKHCTPCHAEGKGKYRAAPIDKNSYQKLIDSKKVVPGKPDESPVYTTMADADEPMPPKRVMVRPTAEEIATVKTWIEKGAPAWPTN
jgi:hypothetical protein